MSVHMKATTVLTQNHWTLAYILNYWGYILKMIQLTQHALADVHPDPHMVLFCQTFTAQPGATPDNGVGDI